MSATKPRVLIPSGAGAPGFGGILNCLKLDDFAWVAAGDCNPLVYGSAMADQFYEMPSSDKEDAYLKRLKNVVSESKIDLILPITTRELEVLSKNKSLIESWGTMVVVSEIGSLEIANDKSKLHGWCIENQVPVPIGAEATSWVEFEQICDKILRSGQRVCFKPSTGNGSRGLGFVCAQEDLRFSLGKPGEVWMTVNEWKLRLANAFDLGLKLLVAEYLPGKEYSVDALVIKNEAVLCIPRTRDKMVGGISVAGELKKNESLINLSKNLILSLGLEGPIGVQWRADERGNFKLLEINPRLQGTTSAALLGGVNIPQKTVKRYLEIEDNQSNEPNWGVRFSRFWKDVGISYYLRDHYE